MDTDEARSRTYAGRMSMTMDAPAADRPPVTKDRSKTEEEALKETFGLNFRKLDAKWRDYVTAGFTIQ